MAGLNVTLRIQGLETMFAQLSELGPSLENRVWPQSLRAAAVVIARVARRLDYGFRDRTKRLRRSIRVVGIPAIYGGRRYKRGRAAVFAGGEGARQAYLVERGHGGPVKSPPYPYLGRALLESEQEQYNAFVERAKIRFPSAVAHARRRRSGAGAVTARTFARRARRGR